MFTCLLLKWQVIPWASAPASISNAHQCLTAVRGITIQVLRAPSYELPAKGQVPQWDHEQTVAMTNLSISLAQKVTSLLTPFLLRKTQEHYTRDALTSCSLSQSRALTTNTPIQGTLGAIRSASSFDYLTEIYHEQKKSLHPAVAAALLHRYAVLNTGQSQATGLPNPAEHLPAYLNNVIKHCRLAVLDNLGDCGAQELEQLLVAWASSRYFPTSIDLLKICDRLLDSGGVLLLQTSHRTLANIVWGVWEGMQTGDRFGNIESPRALMHQLAGLANIVLKRLHDTHPVPIAIMLPVFCAAMPQDRILLNTLTSALYGGFSELNPALLTNTLVTMQRADLYTADLWDDAANAAMYMLPTMSAAQITSLAASLAAYRHTHMMLLEGLTAHALAMCPTPNTKEYGGSILTIHHMATLMISLADLDCYHPELFQAGSNEMAQKPKLLSGVTALDILCSCAHVGHSDTHLFDSLCNMLMTGDFVSQLSYTGLKRLMKALYGARHLHLQMCDSIAVNTAAHIKEQPALEVVQLVEQLVTLSPASAPPLLDALTDLTTNLHSLSTHLCCDLLLSIIHSGYLHPALLTPLLRSLSLRDASTFSPRCHHVLYKACLAMEDAGLDELSDSLRENKKLAKASGRMGWLQKQTRLHEDVRKVLCKLGMDVTCNEWTKDGMVPIALQINSRDRPIAVQVLLHADCASYPFDHPLAEASFWSRCASFRNVNAIRVTEREWGIACNKLNGRAQLLENKLASMRRQA